ncbi:uncharacterized protein LOC132272951 [Cornus florida]|uniref:uncharacterized protein LOC132272951 n=1 Tax=Cornus florida TaxID=4283 RepID=UPI00289D9ED5|nr:uncharacterized protein LOC132272951 [Cornus florida]
MKQFSNHLPTLPWTHLVWSKPSIPKHSFTLWVAIQNRLPTLNQRCTAHINATLCVLCGGEPETHDHLFFNCPYVKPLWTFIQTRCGFHISPSSWEQFIGWVSFHWKGKSTFSSNSISIMCLASLVYNIWIEQNRRIFQKKAISANSLLHITLDSVRSKLLTSRILDLKDPRRTAAEWDLSVEILRPPDRIA